VNELGIRNRNAIKTVAHNKGVNVRHNWKPFCAA